MIHELRTYAIKPGKLAEYVERSGAIGRPIRGDRYGTLLGYFSTEHGALNQVVHLWEFADLGARAAARAGLARDERWVKEYLPVSGPLLDRQENMILNPVDWRPAGPPAGPHGVYELRVYRTHPGKAPQWLGLFREIMPVREKYSSPVGIWSTEIGPLNTVVHLWAYRDGNHRAEVRGAALRDPAWQAFVQQASPLLQVMESKVLVPTAFSPWR
jgi:hypothetical protein